MGLLDSDAEEIKKKSQESEASGTGRKANQSGLGILKGLNKHSGYLEKLRAKDAKASPAVEKAQKATPAPSPVEHLRGTFSNQVQTGGEPSANVVRADVAEPSAKPSANEVQDSGDKVANRVQTGGKQGANEVQSLPSEQGAKPGAITAPKNLNRVQTGLSSILNPELALKAKPGANQARVDSVKDQIQATNSQIYPPEPIEGLVAKSAELIGNGDQKVIENENSDIRADLNRVQTECKDEVVSPLLETKGIINLDSGDSNQVQIEGEQGANRVHEESSFAKKEGEMLVEKPGAIQVRDQFKKEKGLPPNRVQFESNLGANRVQLNNGEPGANQGAVRVRAESSFDSNRVQTGRKPDANWVRAAAPAYLSTEMDSLPKEDVYSLSGSQMVLIEYLYDLCSPLGTTITPRLSRARICQDTNLPVNTMVSTAKRLIKKGIIGRYESKDGVSGWTRYIISDKSFKEMSRLKSGATREELPLIRQKQEAPAAEAPTPGWFLDLDFSKIHPIKGIGVNKAIRTLVQEKLEPEVVQEFINRFMTWVGEQTNISSPIGMFCDKLKELATEGDSPVLYCMTDEERHAEAEFIAKAEKARAEMELIRRAKEEAEAAENTRKFEEWYARSTQKERFDLAGQPPGFSPDGSEVYKSVLKSEFIRKMKM